MKLIFELSQFRFSVAHPVSNAEFAQFSIRYLIIDSTNHLSIIILLSYRFTVSAIIDNLLLHFHAFLCSPPPPTCRTHSSVSLDRSISATYLLFTVLVPLSSRFPRPTVTPPNCSHVAGGCSSCSSSGRGRRRLPALSVLRRTLRRPLLAGEFDLWSLILDLGLLILEL